jgi:phage protein D
MADATKPGISAGSAPAASYEVKVDGLSISTQAEPNHLDRLVVETHLDKIGVAHLSYNGDFKPGAVSIGAKVEISVGGSADPVFTGQVTAFRHSWRGGRETITLEAMDPLVLLAASRNTRVWGGGTSDSITDSDCVQAVLSDAGCTTGNIESTAGSRPYVMQRNESDLAFIKRLAARNGYLVYCSATGEVLFQKPQFSNESLEVTQQDIIQLDYVRSDTHLPSSVVVVGWDYKTKSSVVGESDQVTTIGSGEAAAATTFKGASYVSDVFVDSESGAKAMATAELDRCARTYVQGSCTTVGNGALRTGEKVRFIGSYEGFNPEGLVVGVRHVVEAGTVFQSTFWFVGNTVPS